LSGGEDDGVIVQVYRAEAEADVAVEGQHRQRFAEPISPGDSVALSVIPYHQTGILSTSESMLPV